MSAVDILRAARALIEKQWCQGDDKASDPDHAYGYCAITAFGDSGLRAPYAEYRAARDALQTAIEAGGCPCVVTAWNDSPERTKEDVLAAYDRAITAAKEAA